MLHSVTRDDHRRVLGRGRLPVLVLGRNSEKSWAWLAFDGSGGAPRDVHFFIDFESTELALKVKDTFEVAKTLHDRGRRRVPTLRG